MTAPRLHLIMPCNRPENIPALAKYYLTPPCEHPFEIRWHIFRQGPEPDPKGVYKSNEALDMVRDGWVFNIADDTIQHPALFQRLGQLIKQHPDIGAFVFGQARHGGALLIPGPANMIPCQVCGGQVIWKREFIGRHRWQFDKYLDLCDGYFIRDRYNEHPERFFFCPEVLTMFGSLEWRGQGVRGLVQLDGKVAT